MHLCNFVFSPKRFAWRWKLFMLAKRWNYKRIRADPSFPCLDLCFFSFFPLFSIIFFFYLPLPWNLTDIGQLKDNHQGLQRPTLERTVPSATKMRCTSDSKKEAWKPTYPSHSNLSFASDREKENCNQGQYQSPVPPSSPILPQLRELPNFEVLFDMHSLNKTCNLYWVSFTVFSLDFKIFSQDTYHH